MTRLRGFAASADKSRFGAATAVTGLRRLIERTSATVAALVLLGSARVFACPVCFGAEESSMIDGTKLGIAVLLGITVAVQGAFVGFFFYLRTRAKRFAESELDTEWTDLQRGASRAS
jgi:hypothetical protein